MAQQAPNFPLELDHVAILVTPGAPELQALEALGLHPLGEKTMHGGMGTASTAIFFENVYLELIWVDDPDVAARKWDAVGANMTTRVYKPESHGEGAFPIGLALRRKAGEAGPLP